MEMLSLIADRIWSYGIIFLIVLTVVVFIHELGHFLVARWCGVTVKAFSIGFGPEIAGFNDKHGTRWRFAAIPLGGYVKFIDDENASSAPGTQKTSQLSDDEKQGSFHSKSVAQRSAVVAAGPIANFILAIAIYAGLNLAVGVRIVPAIADAVVPGSVAEKAGVVAGDRIVSINNRMLESFDDLIEIVMPNAGNELDFVIQRGTQELSFKITPALDEGKDPFGRAMRRGLVGIQRSIAPGQVQNLSVGPVEAVTRAVTETYKNITRSLSGLWQIITARQSHEQLGGPLMMAEVTAKVAEAGFEPILRWLAFMSASIGFLNLLPIPVLDGGHLMFYGLEALRRKPVSERIQQAGFQFGFVLLMMMIVFVNFNDILNVWRRLSGTG